MRYHMLVFIIISLAILIKIIDVRSLNEEKRLELQHDETNININTNDYQNSQVITLFAKYNRSRINKPVGVSSTNGSSTGDEDNGSSNIIDNTNVNTGDILINNPDDRIVDHNGDDDDDDNVGKSGELEVVPDEEQYNKEQYSIVGKIVLSSLAGTASLITVCGNLLVMLSFFLDRQIRIPTNYFILSLSVSDFLIGLVSMPFLTLYLMIGRWPFGKIICNLWLSLDYTVCLTSIYTVLFITIDRFCSVKFPAKYRNWRTRNKVIVMVALTWGIPIVLFFPSIFGWSFFSSNIFDARFCDVAWSSNKVFSFGLVFGYFWSTLVAIIVLYIFIYRVARNLERKSREKQRKLSTLVGTSAANAGAVAFPAQVTAAVSRLNSTNQQHQDKQAAQAATNQTQQIQQQLNNNIKQVAGKKQQLNETTTTPDEFQDDQDDDYNTADSQSKLSKGSIKKRRKEHLKFVKRTSKSGAAIGSVGLMTASSILKGNAKQQANATHQTSSSSKVAQHKTAGVALSNQQKSKPLTGVSNNNNNNNSNNLNINNNKQTQLQPKSNLAASANNHSFGSSTVSKDDDYSSSYDSHSHSDYDTTQKHKQQQHQQHTTTNHKKPPINILNRKNSKSNLEKITINQDNPSMQPSQHQQLQQQQQQQQSLQPRPESLAVMSYDQFAEKCAKQSSNLNSNSNPNSTNQTKQSSPVLTATNTNSLVKAVNEDVVHATGPGPGPVQQQLVQQGSGKMKKSVGGNTPAGSTKEQIPYIDDEFDDLSYILTRRHIADKEHKYAIKEEKILIKSPLKSSFFQKFSSPIRSMSRRSSQKSQGEQQTQATTAQTAAQVMANGGTMVTSKLEMLSNQFAAATAANEKNHHHHHHHQQHNHHNDGQQDNEEKVNLLEENTDLVSTNQTSTKLANHLMVNGGTQSSSTAIATNKITPSSTFTAITTTTTLSNSPTVNCLKQQAQPQSQQQQANSNQQNASSTVVNGPQVIQTCDNSKVSASDHNNSSSNTKLAFDDGIQAGTGAGGLGAAGANANNTAAGTQTGTISSRHQITSRPLTRMVRHENRARKALRTITFILGAFIFCFAPWHVVTIFNPFCPECFESAAYHHFFYSCYFLCYLNSPINPFMYALANQQFKKTFTRILKGDFRRV